MDAWRFEYGPRTYANICLIIRHVRSLSKIFNEYDMFTLKFFWHLFLVLSKYSLNNLFFICNPVLSFIKSPSFMNFKPPNNWFILQICRNSRLGLLSFLLQVNIFGHFSVWLWFPDFSSATDSWPICSLLSPHYPKEAGNE